MGAYVGHSRAAAGPRITAAYVGKAERRSRPQRSPAPCPAASAAAIAARRRGGEESSSPSDPAADDIRSSERPRVASDDATDVGDR